MITRTEHGLQCEQVALADVAQAFGTPLYFYSWDRFRSSYLEYDEAFGDKPHQICYSVKASSNLTLLSRLAKLGSGFDIVSEGELIRCLTAGAAPEKIVFSGVGKTEAAMTAALKAGIGCFNVESEQELMLLDGLASALKVRAPFALRINPDIAIESHAYISTGTSADKFGVPLERGLALYQKAQSQPGLRAVGIACHIGSQMTNLAAFEKACMSISAFAETLIEAGISLGHIDMGGGLGITYSAENPAPTPSQFVAPILKHLSPLSLALWIEPGRSIAGAAGGLITKVLYLKEGVKNFCIVDASMTECLRPALYDAVHTIESIEPVPDIPAKKWDVVGPVCESGDFLGRDRTLALSLGQLLLIHDTGAYAAAMASNYNTRPLAPEVLIDGNKANLIRMRQSLSDIYAGECIL